MSTRSRPRRRPFPPVSPWAPAKSATSTHCGQLPARAPPARRPSPACRCRRKDAWRRSAPGVGAAWRLDDLMSNLDSVIMRRKHRSQVQATCKCLEHTPALLRGAVTLLTMAPGQSRGRWPSAPALPPADSASSKPWISLMVLCLVSVIYKSLCKPVRALVGSIDLIIHQKQKSESSVRLREFPVLHS